MSAFSEFFFQNIIFVYFLYGLSFFSMGLAVLLELAHASESDFAKALRPLAAFGILHGSHEWIEMFLLIHAHLYGEPAIGWIGPLRFVLLFSSFLMLVIFGARLIAGSARRNMQLFMIFIVLLLWAIGLVLVLNSQASGLSKAVAVDVYTRYSLAIPGSVLAAWGLLLQRQKFLRAGMVSFARDVSIVAVAFALYGCVGQLFASSSVIFPSAYLNADVFVRIFGFPVQVFRAVIASIAAVFILRSLRAFEVENRQRIEGLRQAQLEERQRLEDMREEFLRRTVKTQERERRRIARELHDETGQTLTALGLGLRGLSEAIESKPQRAKQQAKQLESLAIDGLEELQHLVSGLRPPQLDDLGLLAALRWCANEMVERHGVPIEVTGRGNGPELPADVRVVFFRIAQEAVTNMVRHADAKKAEVLLEYTQREVHLQIKDDGKGFHVEEKLDNTSGYQSWGLLGMRERAALIGAEWDITSQPGDGTVVDLRLQLPPG